MIHRQSLSDDATCFETVRDLRWPNGVHCPTCESAEVTTPGRDETQPARQRSLGTSCAPRVDDWTNTSLAGPHPPLRGWMLCWYVMGLNRSNHPMAHELARTQDDVPQMTCQVRQGLVVQTPHPTWRDTVEGAAVYRVAGHTGQPKAVGKTGGAAGADGSRAHVAAARSPPRTRRAAG